jgi:RNA polymerase sigma-70 factor (ECF subfamily)
MTTTQVLEDLRSHSDGAAWKGFSEHFGTVVARFARHCGLSAADAEDAAQETMLIFVRALHEGKYDRQKGRLRDWLFGIARHATFSLRNQRSREQLVADGTGTSFWDMVQDDRAVEQSWQREWEKMTAARCLEQVRREVDARAMRAFELYAIEEEPAEQVARKLEMSRNAVYIAKSRVLSRLRELQREFD